MTYAALAEQRSRILEALDLTSKGYALATVHRAENTDDPERLRKIFAGLKALAHEGLPVVFPIHPRTKKQAGSFGIKLDSVQKRVGTASELSIPENSPNGP